MSCTKNQNLCSILKYRYQIFALIFFMPYFPSISADETIKATPVTTFKVTQTSMKETTLVRGEIESPNTPFIGAKVAAEVSEIKADEGMQVLKGQLLARLDDEAFTIAEQSARANKQRLLALVENQQRKVNRSEELYGKKLISKSDLDDIQSVMKQLQAELLGAESILNKALYQLSHTKIVSPINGIIQQRIVSKGDYVKIGNPIFNIVSTEQVRARVYFPNTLSSIIHTGMQVHLINKNQTVMGIISSIRPMMENGNRALHALVKFDNNNWKPGTSIVAKTILAERPDAIAVPQKAVVRRPSGVVLYKIMGQKVAEQKVTTGLRQDQLIEVTSGINIGDEIVLDGAAWLSDGAAIDIQNSGFDK